MTLIILGIGALSGILLGMGLGGGTLLIPLLLWIDIPQRSAQAVAIVGFLPAAGVSLWMAHRKGLIEWPQVRAALIWLVLGAVAGSVTAGLVPVELLRRGFGVALLGMGLAMGWKTIKKAPR